jgi:hypothetical protein
MVIMEAAYRSKAPSLSGEADAKYVKVFCFFFSKKKSFFFASANDLGSDY